MTMFSDIRTVKVEAYKKIVNGFIPKTVYVSLNQNMNTCEESLVKTGDKVEEGQEIAKGIYSPIPGIVDGFEMQVMPDGKISKVVKIKLGGKFSFLGKKKTPCDYKLFSSSSLIRHIESYGVLNTFFTAKPVLLSKQLEEVSKHKHRILVVRFIDDDPSRLIDSVLTNEYLDEIISGVQIASYCINAERVIFIVEKEFNELEKLEKSLENSFVLKISSKAFSICNDKLLCKLIKKQFKEETLSKISKYDLFTDSSSMLELYRCVSKSMPVIDRYVLVNGNCLPATGILKVPVGTSFESIVEQFGGFIKNPSSVIVNGQITGFSTGSLKVPVTKYVKSISFYSFIKTPDQSVSLCIRCGRCRNVCPMHLSPDVILRHITGGEAAPADYMKTVKYCIECGLCNSICPSRLPVMQKMEEYKQSNLNILKEEKDVRR